MGHRRNHTSYLRVTFALTFAPVLFINLSHAQKITNVDFQVIDNRVKISYDISDCNGGKSYDIRLSLGKDGKVTTITNGLSGDIKKVPCGSSNSITWDVLSDREELTGRIYFVVEVERIHTEIHANQEVTEGKRWSRRSWKADKGYAGGSIGVFTPYDNYSKVPYNLEPNGFFINATIGYLPSLFLGISSTIYIYGAIADEKSKIASWTNCGFMIGPLISLPIGNKIKWELRPQMGYSIIAATSALSDLDSLETITSGVAFNLNSGLRLNFGKRTCYMLNLEYLSPPRKFDDYPAKADLGTLGASFGVAFRFY